MFWGLAARNQVPPFLAQLGLCILLSRLDAQARSVVDKLLLSQPAFKLLEPLLQRMLSHPEDLQGLGAKGVWGMCFRVKALKV